jgi:hypothetical protein
VQASRWSKVLLLVFLDGLGTYFLVQETIMMTNIIVQFTDQGGTQNSNRRVNGLVFTTKASSKIHAY